MSTFKQYSRRDFLGSCITGGFFAGLPLAPKMIWAASGEATTPFRIAFYTDIHARVQWDTPVAMAKAAAAIKAQKADLVIAGGDLITDGFQSHLKESGVYWDAYMEMHQAIGQPIFPMIGNHDLVGAAPADGSKPRKKPREIFLEKMGLDQTYYSFEECGYRFIFLDGIEIRPRDNPPYRGRIPEEQIMWLKEELSAIDPKTPIVLGTHIPLLTLFYQALDGAKASIPPHKAIQNNIEVLELFKNHNLILVLQGHMHVNEFLQWRGTTFITGGAICAKWWRGNWHGTEEGFGIVTLRGNRVEWEYIDYGWESRRPVDA